MKKLSKLLVSLFLYVILTLSNVSYNNIETKVETKNNRNLIAVNQRATKRTLKNIAVFI